MKIAGIICDIEGTTSSISFVHRVLFPLAQQRLRQYLIEFQGDAELQQQLGYLWRKLNPGVAAPADLGAALAPVLEGYIRNDVKDTTLKWAQGKIWRQAFENGEVRGHVYGEVADLLRLWKNAGLKLFIYSSGSVEAQQLMFRYSEAGDLSQLLDGYFDTTTGGKREQGSYVKIAAAVGFRPESLLFLSDVKEELDAAAAAGMQTCLLLREGATPPVGYTAKVAVDFSGVNNLFF